MTLFSQRMGITPLKKTIQKDSIDNELRTRLWNVLKTTVLDYGIIDDPTRISLDDYTQLYKIIDLIWMEHFKFPIDQKPDFLKGSPKSAYTIIREYFFSCKWYELYDFMDFILIVVPERWIKKY